MPNISLDDLRADLPVTGEVAYFQTGTYGPTPDSVLRVVREEMEFDSHHAVGDPDAKHALAERESRAREKLAALLSVRPEGLAMTPNTSRAMQRVIRSIQWKEGDEIVVSSLEHVSTVGVCQVLEQHYGVTVRWIEADQGDGLFLESLESALGERTRLLCVSHVTSADGRVLPVAEAADLAHDRAVPVVVDGAQSVGQFPVDVSSLGCDYFVGSGHKWLLGPMGTGYLWVASDQLGDFRPEFIPDHSPWKLPDEPAPTVTASSRAEIGTYNLPMIIGLGRAVDNLIDIGLDVVTSHVSRLSEILREEISRLKGATSITPMEPERSAGITTLMFDGFDHKGMQRLVDQLMDEDRVLVKNQWLTAPPQPRMVGMRVSIAAFNTEEEVMRLVDGLKSRLLR